ncbi:thioesterase family protein [Verminephrobacter eiseniae]|uniref:thioesterase family protein n=1 Tax=Verminephrobacter eiseniae TaxID=364317 RepID=UPI0018DC56AD|nr:thioesterase family protein [Verminephrobacter eiseniae]
MSYADTDAGGVVYHGRYIEQAERSRQQLLLDAELSFSALEREYDCLLVVHAIDASYEHPAFLGQKLHVSCAIRQLREAYSVWETRIEHGQVHLCSVAAKMVCLAAHGKNLRTMPDELFQRLSKHPFLPL